MPGRKGKGQYDKAVNVRMKKATHEKLLDIAERRGENVNTVIRKSIKSEIEYAEDKSR